MKQNVKKIITMLLLAVMLFSVAVPATSVQTDAATKTVKIAVKKKTKKAKKTLNLKSKTKLQVMDGKKKISASKVKFKSSNKKVANVSKGGVIAAKKVGKAVITVRYKKKTARITVTVIRPVKSIKLNKTKLTLKKGGSKTLTAKVLPSNATNKSVTWKSENKKIATVNSNGMVTGKKPGTTTVTATTNQGNKVASCEVTVSGSGTSSPTTTTEDGQIIPTDPDQGGNTNANEVTVNGVVFDVSNFPAQYNMPQNEYYGDSLTVIPRTKINMDDISVVVNNNKYVKFADEEQMIIPNWDNFCALVRFHKGEWYENGTPLDCFSVYMDQGAKTGKFEVAVYYKNSLIRKSTVAVTKANEDYEKYRKKIDKIKSESLKYLPADATIQEKLGMIQSYVYTHYFYQECTCISGANIIAWVARDLGYRARFRYWDTEERKETVNVSASLYHTTTEVEVSEGNWIDVGTQGYDLEGETEAEARAKMQEMWEKDVARAQGKS